MKRFILVLAVLAIPFWGFASTALPQGRDTLRVLTVGNSFSEDCMQWLPDLLEAAGIHNVILGNLAYPGCSMEKHCVLASENSPSYLFYKSGSGNKWSLVRGKTFQEGLQDEPWDIISLQQVSGLSGVWESYEPWLETLKALVLANATNPEVVLVWHQTWSYSRTSGHGDFPRYQSDQKRMYESILSCNRKVTDGHGIEVLVPDGAATMLLRSTKANPGTDDITRDGFHHDLGMGRFLLSCVWFEAIIRPCLGISVRNNPCRLEGTEFELDPSTAEICRRTAVKAVRKPYAKYRKPKD